MSRKYQIWNKTDNIITPIGEVLSPQDWLARYPMGNILDLVIGGGVINGSFCAAYDAFKAMYEDVIDFSDCETKQDCLDKIQEYEEREPEPEPEPTIDDVTRMADALEDLVVLNMPDEEEEEGE